MTLGLYVSLVLAVPAMRLLEALLLERTQLNITVLLVHLPVQTSYSYLRKTKVTKL